MLLYAHGSSRPRPNLSSQIAGNNPSRSLKHRQVQHNARFLSAMLVNRRFTMQPYDGKLSGPGPLSTHHPIDAGLPGGQQRTRLTWKYIPGHEAGHGQRHWMVVWEDK
jgi:hypothetical protein